MAPPGGPALPSQTPRRGAVVSASLIELHQRAAGLPARADHAEHHRRLDAGEEYQSAAYEAELTIIKQREARGIYD